MAAGVHLFFFCLSLVRKRLGASQNDESGNESKAGARDPEDFDRHLPRGPIPKLVLHRLEMEKIPQVCRQVLVQICLERPR